jgi:hypothetical protein
LAGSTPITAQPDSRLLVAMPTAWLLALVLSPGGLLNELLKIVFQRARPTSDHPTLIVTGYSRGCTMMATLLMGFRRISFRRSSAGAGTSRRLRRRAWRSLTPAVFAAWPES